MKNITVVDKEGFIQHTSQYLKQAELQGGLIIVNQNKPALELIPIKVRNKSTKDLRGLIPHVKGNINNPILPAFTEGKC